MKRETSFDRHSALRSISYYRALVEGSGKPAEDPGRPSFAGPYLHAFLCGPREGLAQEDRSRGGIHSDEYRHPAAGHHRRQYQFFPSLSTGISAAVAGLPLVVVLNFYDITPWMLVTSKDINKPQDLIGKKVAISGIRTTGHYLMMAWFKKVEISDKDVGFIMTGGTASSFASLASGQVAGAVLTPPSTTKRCPGALKVHADWRSGGHSDLRLDRCQSGSHESTGQSSKDHRGAARRRHLDTRQSDGIRKNDRGQVQDHTG